MNARSPVFLLADAVAAPPAPPHAGPCPEGRPPCGMTSLTGRPIIVRLPDQLCPPGETLLWRGERYRVEEVRNLRDGVVLHVLIPTPRL